jgi:chemotaxis protein CheD
MDRKTLHVSLGQIVVAEAPALLTTVLGSCTALVVYDPAKKIGGMAHILSTGDASKNDCRFSDPATERILADVRARAGGGARLVGKLAGGASTVYTNETSILRDIGKHTVLRIATLLVENGLDITGMDMGGVLSRSVTFDLDTGVMSVATKERQITI